MIEFNNTKVYGFEGAIRGMRHPFKGTDKSDSRWKKNYSFSSIPDYAEYMGEFERHSTYTYRFEIGPNDLKLAQRLADAGPDHGKFLRGIHVQVDITAPAYWIAEHDTYKISTVRNSESFMHKGVSEGFTIDKFDTGLDIDMDENLKKLITNHWDLIMKMLEFLRKEYNKTKDYKYFLMIRKLLPSGWKITYFWDANYATLKNIYNQRKNHRLPEWHVFCKWIEELPYSELITGVRGE